LNEEFSDGVADARGRTGDKGALAFELQIHTDEMRRAGVMMLRLEHPF
jgi:hypothetical protein